ncbi:Protein of unknown function DUF2793 [Paracoccaceae bacterium]
MPDDTTILSLPLILPAQAQKHVTHNEALAQLDMIVQLAVIDRVLTTAPALPTLGDRHIVAAGATGPWVGQSGRIALYGETGWQFTQALPGWQAHVLAEGQTAVFDGLGWETLSDGPLTVTQLGVSAVADATNRLVVSSPAVLLNHAGAGHQLKLNKAAAGDTASLLFQTGFSGRAEMGTAGSDGFDIKVSADGAVWATALGADAATGEVTLPKPLHLGGQAADPGAPADGTLWLNTTTGEVKVRSAGVTSALGGGGVSDGDKGDVTVSAGVWSIDAGAVTLAKLADIATDSLLGRDTAGTGVPEALTPAQARGILNVADGANNYSHPNHTGDVSSTGDGATVIAALAVTSGKIADDAVGNDKLANMAFGTIKARTTAGTGNPENATGTEVTALLDTFTSGAKGLVPASGGGTVNFLRADGTFAAPGGGGSPGGATGEVQYNNAGAFAGAADVEIETGQLRLAAIATPTAPAADGVKLFGRSVGGRAMPAFMGPSGLDSALQPHMGHNRVALMRAIGSSTVLHVLGMLSGTTGTATSAAVGTTNRHSRMARLEYLATTASTSAVVGFRGSSAQWTLGASTAGDGGFHMVYRWAPATGVATATHRAFAGMRGNTAAPSDVEPSTLTSMCGMGWDAADTNIQFMHNDASGIATKIDLGASFPVPTVDRTSVYEIALFAPPGTTQSLSYEVTDLVSGAVATGTVTTDLPATSQLLVPYNYMSVGGTSSVVGIAIMGLYIESDY